MSLLLLQGPTGPSGAPGFPGAPGTKVSRVMHSPYSCLGHFSHFSFRDSSSLELKRYISMGLALILLKCFFVSCFLKEDNIMIVCLPFDTLS